MVCTTKADVFIRRQVQWYDLQPGMEDDALVQHGCQHLAWAVHGEGRRSAPWYSVSYCFSLCIRPLYFCHSSL